MDDFNYILYSAVIYPLYCVIILITNEGSIAMEKAIITGLFGLITGLVLSAVSTKKVGKETSGLKERTEHIYRETSGLKERTVKISDETTGLKDRNLEIKQDLKETLSKVSSLFEETKRNQALQEYVTIPNYEKMIIELKKVFEQNAILNQQLINQKLDIVKLKELLQQEKMEKQKLEIKYEELEIKYKELKKEKSNHNHEITMSM